VTQQWIAGAIRAPATRPGVPFTVRHRRAVWHTTETALGTLDAVVRGYERTGSWPHATWDPSTGRVKQHYTAEIGARALRNTSGGIETNSFGALQVEVVGYARSPFTGGPMRGVQPILNWLRANGVPGHWPAGQPLAYGADERRPGVTPAAYGLGNGTRKPSAWMQPGHFGHSQVPENEHGDPGRIDTTFTEDDDMPTVEEIADAVWGYDLRTHDDRIIKAITALNYTYRRAIRVEETLAGLPDAVAAKIPAGGGASPEQIKAAVQSAIREMKWSAQ